MLPASCLWSPETLQRWAGVWGQEVVRGLGEKRTRNVAGAVLLHSFDVFVYEVLLFDEIFVHEVLCLRS